MMPFNVEGQVLAPGGDIFLSITHVPEVSSSNVVVVGQGNKEQIWVVDISGSMSSSMGSLRHALETCWNNLPPGMPKPRIIAFNHGAEELPPKNGVCFPYFQAGGGTCFQNALMQLIETHDKHQFDARGRVPVILFFTDGCDNGGSYYYTGGPTVRGHQQTIQATNNPFLSEIFWPWLTKCRGEFHVIGYSSQHDVTTMQKLIQVPGAPNGLHSYQYAPDKDEIMATVERISQMARPQISLTIANQILAWDLDRPTSSSSSSTSSDEQRYCLLPSASVQPLIDKEHHYGSVISAQMITPDGQTSTIELPIQPPGPSFPAPERMQLLVLERHISSLANNPTSDELASIDDRLNHLLPDLMRLRGQARKDCLHEFYQFKEQVAAIAAILAKGIHNASTEERARVLQTAKMIRTDRRGLNKKLDTRMAAQSGLRQEVKVLAKRNAQAVAKASDQEVDHDDWICVMSHCNWLEAIEEEDCLCVTLIVTRPAVAIAQPALLQVQQVNLQIMTFETFQDAVQTGILRAVDEIKAHGGFDLKQQKPTIIKDRVIEPCNAVLPLRIHLQHWNTARHLMKLALGWMCTLDERGFAPSQWHTVPVLIYEWLHMHPDPPRADIHGRMLAVIKDTVLAMLGGPEKVEERYREIVGGAQYPKLTSLCKEELPNLTILFGWLHLLDESSPPPFFVRLLTMEMYRRQISKPADQNQALLTTLIDLYGLTETSIAAISTTTNDDNNNNNNTTCSVTPIISVTELKPKYQRTLSGILDHLKAVLSLPDNPIISLQQALALTAWALMNGFHDKITRTIQCPDPYVHPQEANQWFQREIAEEWAAERARKLAAVNCSSAVEQYLTTSMIPFPYQHHLYGGGYLGQMLRRLRASMPNTVPNAEAKFRWLREREYWSPSCRNNRAWHAQFTSASSL